MMWDLFDVQVRCLEIVMQCQQGHFSHHEHNFQCPGINLFFDLLIITLGHEHFRGRSVWKWSSSVTLLDVTSWGFCSAWRFACWNSWYLMKTKELFIKQTFAWCHDRLYWLRWLRVSSKVYIYLNSILLWPTLNMIGEVPCSFTARIKYLKK